MRSRVFVAYGVMSAAAAIVVLARGGSWWAFWPGLLAVSLLTGPVRRRYWNRVERDDPASVPLKGMWVIAGWVTLALLLCAMEFAGLWVRQSTGRGLGILIAACLFAIGWAQARATRKRLLGHSDGGEARS